MCVCLGLLGRTILTLRSQLFARSQSGAGHLRHVRCPGIFYLFVVKGVRLILLRNKVVFPLSLQAVENLSQMP